MRAKITKFKELLFKPEEKETISCCECSQNVASEAALDAHRERTGHSVRGIWPSRPE